MAYGRLTVVALRFSLVLSLLFVSVPISLSAQGLDFSAALGLAGGTDTYQSNCGHGTIAASVSVEGTRRVFPHVSLDRFAGSGGGDVLCMRAGKGGLRLDGATRVGLGVGARIGSRWAGVQGAMVVGLVSGRRGYTMEGVAADRVVAPHVGASGTAVLLNHLLFTVAFHWTRLSMTEAMSGRTGSITSREWSPMTTVQVGARFSLGSR